MTHIVVVNGVYRVYGTHYVLAERRAFETGLPTTRVVTGENDKKKKPIGLFQTS